MKVQSIRIFDAATLAGRRIQFQASRSGPFEEAKTFSLYCGLEKATDEVSGNFKHRGAAMQEARFVIGDSAPNRKNHEHRPMGYNNDPTTTFADIQRCSGW